MSFISWSFVWLFSVVMACRWLLSARKTGAAYLVVLLAASVTFYGWHVRAYVLILMTSSVVDYGAALLMHHSPTGSRRRRWLLVLSLVVNLGLLVVFKYADFGLEIIEGIVSWLGRDAVLPRLDLVLPMGLSFYTFSALSYTIDVYRGELKPERHFGRFLLFICFFPHLMAGPIIRARDFLRQIRRPRRVRLRVFNAGLYLIIEGAFWKMVCANQLAIPVQAGWNEAGFAQRSSAELALLALMFSGQIFCDFAGYSQMARGMAYLLGFRFPVNFNLPYIAGTFSGFWRRWHMTLSAWLRDYLYVPLGGNRVSKPRTYVNVALVMVIGGLWHGAALTYVAWGAMHGAALMVERAAGLHKQQAARRRRAVRLLWFVVVQSGVVVAWVFFRSASVAEGLDFVGAMARFQTGLPPARMLGMAVFLLPVGLAHAHGFLVERGLLPALGKSARAVLAGVMVFLIFIAYGINSSFIYFQF